MLYFSSTLSDRLARSGLLASALSRDAEKLSEVWLWTGQTKQLTWILVTNVAGRN